MRSVSAQKPVPRETEAFRLLLATSRPAVHSFFLNLGRDKPSSRFVVTRIQVAVDAIAHGDELADATIAAVDVGLDQKAAVEFCRELQQRRPDLPVTAVVCCPHSVTPWNLRTLIAVGVSSLVDLQATSEEVARALESVARGGAVLQLHSFGHQRASLRDLLAAGELKSRTQIQLLELVALGLPDREIGRRLHLSPHTVKHQIENLRDELGVRNRTELAAWAGRHGFYASNAGRAAS